MTVSEASLAWDKDETLNLEGFAKDQNRQN